MNNITSSSSFAAGNAAKAVGSYLESKLPVQEKAQSAVSTQPRQDSTNFSLESILASEGYNRHGVKFDKKEDGTYDIRFRDTAYVFGAIERGTLEVDGKEVPLGDKVKDMFKKAADSINARREKLMDTATALHNEQVYDQQSKAMMEAKKKEIDAYNIAARMSQGNIVSHDEESMLLKTDPQMYLMAKLAQHMAKEHEKDQQRLEEDTKKKAVQEQQDDPLEHLSSFHVDANVDISGGTLEVSSISETEIPK